MDTYGSLKRILVKHKQLMGEESRNYADVFEKARNTTLGLWANMPSRERQGVSKKRGNALAGDRSRAQAHTVALGVLDLVNIRER